MVIELYIMRHGETNYNVEERAQGQVDLKSKLTKKGKSQVKKQAKKIKSIPFDRIYCSDLRRTKESNKIILKHIKDVPVEYRSELRERGCGSLQGKTIQELGITDYTGKDLYPINQEGIFADVESLESVDGRVNEIIQKILQTNDSKILIVGHGWINSYFINALLKEGHVFHDQKNASIHYFKLDDQGKVLEYELADT